MFKIAALVERMSLNQNIYYLTKSFNELARSHEYSPCIYYHNLSAVGLTTHFSISNIYYANLFNDGVMIATCLETLKTLNNINSKCRKYYYCQDLEWLRTVYEYESIVSLFKSDVKIIARSLSHARNIENYSNKKVDHLMTNWDINKLKVL